MDKRANASAEATDIIGTLATPEERRAAVQRAYDDGFFDGRLDVNREHETRIVELQDQVDYWRALVNSEVGRLRELLALQIEQADEANDEAYAQGHSDGWHDADCVSDRDL